MTYIIIIAIIALIGLCMWYAKKVESNPNHPLNQKSENEIKIYDRDDNPVGFGYKVTWLAIKTNNQQQVADIIGLKNQEASNWKSGIESAYSKKVFVTPEIDGWILVVGNTLPGGDSEQSIEEATSLLKKLSKEFGEAQLFSTHRVVEFHCWMKSTNGNIDRIYSYLGESGENIHVFGKPTEIEKKYTLINTLSEEAKQDDYWDKEDLTSPDEELVMTISDNWSVNPTLLDNRQDIKGLGLIGKR